MSGLGLASWLCWPQLGGLSPLATQTVNYFLSRSVPAASQAGQAAPPPSPALGVGLGWQEAAVPRRGRSEGGFVGFWLQAVVWPEIRKKRKQKTQNIDFQPQISTKGERKVLGTLASALGFNFYLLAVSPQTGASNPSD